MIEPHVDAGPLCAAFAFYGGRHTPESAAAFHEHIAGWYDRIGHPLQKQTLKRNGRRGRVSRRVITEGFSGVESVEMYTTDPAARNSMSDYIRCASWMDGSDITEPPLTRALALLWHDAAIADLDDSSLRQAVQAFIAASGMTYVVGYRRDRGFGPGHYACSTGWRPHALVEPPDHDEDHKGQWHHGMFAQLYNCGVLRYVYPLNYLNASQMSNRIAGQALANWIRADASRGSLRELEGTGLTLWEVPDAALDAMRAALGDAGLTFNRDRYIASLGERAFQVPKPHPSRLR